MDGFNFYYGCVRGTPYKWLDLEKFADLMLPPNDVRVVKYFTARVEARQGDPDQATRQETYFRALRTLPRTEIVLGRFLTNPVRLPRADRRGFAFVLRTEEKGSDVNLATHLVHDAHQGLIDCAVIVSNDSDLAEPVRIVRRELGLVVGIITPTLKKGRYPSRTLIQHATFIKRVRAGVLAKSQFPNPVRSPARPIFKPTSW
jgi:uncharacterized LabA/DUF88 family protein